MVTTKDIRFIVINKQEDLPTDIEIKGRLSFEIEFPLIQESGATQIEELVLPNGDIIVSNKFFQKVDSTVPLNVEASFEGRLPVIGIIS